LGCIVAGLKRACAKGKWNAVVKKVVKQGMGPIAAGDARLFILGSLPGDASLAAQRYYAHPTNQFWRLLGDAIGEPLAELDYERRLVRLAKRGIGLWDVVASAERAGSLDGAIREAGLNPIERLREDFPELRGIAFNGGTAARAGRKLLGTVSGIALIDLPSSSAANTGPFADKAAKWRQLGRFCRSGLSAA
jgi:double-stranded uracil-DNA glycosylase